MKSSKKKKRVRELYRNGYNAAEIADIITKENAAEGINKKTTREAIKKCIQRNFKDLKREHKENAKARKEVERALDYESKKFISDKSLILKNRSAYETKNNGDIVLKLLGYVAQRERENIKTRQAEGIASAKAKGTKFGRPSGEIPKDFIRAYDLYKQGFIKVKDVMSMCNIKRSTFFKYAQSIKS